MMRKLKGQDLKSALFQNFWIEFTTLIKQASNYQLPVKYLLQIKWINLYVDVIF